MIVRMAAVPTKKTVPKSARSGKAKEELEETMAENLMSETLTKDLLNRKPLKTFMQRVQHEFRVYITLENAWPRKRSNIIEKREVPKQIIEMTAGKYEGYQGQEFQKLFRKVWKEDTLHEVMIKQVSV